MMFRSSKLVAAIATGAALAASAAEGQTVFQSTFDNGFFTPFNSATASTVRYADSGWFGFGSDAGVGLQSITLGLVITGSTRAGTTDLSFTFNDGDPSHLVFGTGAQLYATTIHNFALPDASENGGPVFYSVTIPLSGVSTLGGFNNVGWSVGVSNFDSDGSFGFQCSSAFAQPVGFYTNNATHFDGTSWSQFSFGSGAFGVANFVAEINAPAPAAAVPLFAAGLLARRRRR